MDNGAFNWIIAHRRMGIHCSQVQTQAENRLK